MKEEIRPIYSALVGCLTSCPLVKEHYDIDDQSIWDQYNGFLDSLRAISGEALNQFGITIRSNDWGRYVSTQEYRTKLSSLIMYLHGKYFQDEVVPFGSGAGMVINQLQSQNQSVQISIITELRDVIDRKLYGEKIEDKEKDFLEKVKVNLPRVKNIVEMLQMIITLANSLGVDTNMLAKLFVK